MNLEFVSTGPTSAVEGPHPHHHLDISSAAWSHGDPSSIHSGLFRQIVREAPRPSRRPGVAQVCQYGKTSRERRDKRRQQVRGDGIVSPCTLF